MEKSLPSNWVSMNLKKSVDFRKGKKPEILKEEYFQGAVPYMDIKGLEKGIVNFYSDSSSAKYFRHDDVVIVWDGSRSGLILKPKSGAIGSTLGALSPIGYNSQFLYYFLLSHYEKINSKARGVGIPHVDPTYLWNLSLPLPPLAEQERIVAKLDILFAQYELMKKALERIPQLLKDFRHQVLTQAVNGKLTEGWRKTSSIGNISPISIGSTSDLSPETWSWRKLTSLARLESGHTPRKSRDDYWINGDVPWISLQDIRKANGKTISETIFKPNQIGIKNSSARLLPSGTVCFCRDISVGYVTIMGTSMATSQHFANWICSDSLLNKYLMYAFMASKDSLVASGTGTTVSTIYMPALKEMQLLTPEISEQQEIVSRVESFFVKADRIEEKYNILKNKINNLPQTILHKAFRGELVEQLPTDGDAKDLLEEIKKLKIKK